MATYTTLEEIKDSFQTSLFGDDLIVLRPEQRDAIDRAKERFCSKSGSKTGYVYTPLSEYRQFLWNAKMRFGKTICALQLAREMDVRRTLIVTHRPAVGDGWMKAFEQVFGSAISENCDIRCKYDFGTRSDADNRGNFYDLERFVETDGNHYVFFVSMQYLRLSELVNVKTLAKNSTKEQQETLFGHSDVKENEKLKADILKTKWDLVIIDEAHEGTRTALGESVIKDFLKKEKTKMLHLSGTPFNLYEDFDAEKEVFTWDYIAEQQAKLRWEVEHPNEKNPYADLPQMNIFTYDIRKNISQVLDQDGVFTFNEFFRTWTGNPKADHAIMPEGAKGRFVHEEDVKKFLDLLCTKDDTNNFPFSTNEYRSMFRHTLWVVSHIDEAKALETMLKEHPTFRRFKIVNVAGNVETDEQQETALDVVNSAIGEMPEKTWTITISCGRLTTGVTVEPWTAVLYLKGGDNAATYMQTIFRVQSPYKTHDGKMKTQCYVFDFAPDRTLKIVAETAKFSSITKKDANKAKEGDEDKTQEMRDKETVKDFVDLCPVISMTGGQMSPLSIDDIYKKLESVFIDRLVRKGFDDPCLYNQEELNSVAPEVINHIGENGGQAADEKRKEAKTTVDLSHMTPEQRAAWEAKIAQKKAEASAKARKKTEKDAEFKKQWESWSEEEKQQWIKEEAERMAKREKAKEEREEFRKRITNIRGIALRIPLLMYGGADAGDTTEDLTIDNFTRKIKDESWKEFMQKITKDDFNKIKKCFNATRFMEAGKRYRELVREADFMHVEDRIKQITEIFSYFRNPDKETVLTPWRVVNMHMSDTIGGWCFFDETFDEKNGQIDKPRFIDQGDVTQELFNSVDDGGEVQTKILEINSKTGLYPLYVTYSLYRRRLEEYVRAERIAPETISVQEEQVVWDDIVADNMFVICNTPMAAGITRRTLFGFRQVEKKANIKAEKLVEKASDNQDELVKELKSLGFWKGTTSKEMIKFSAVVGNPPYQEVNGGNGNGANPVYHLFIDVASQLSVYGTMIHPARFLFDAGKTPKEWNKRIKSNPHFIVSQYWANSIEVFPNVDVKGGIATTFWDNTREIGPIGTFSAFEELHSILDKIKNKSFVSFSDLVYPRDLYRITEEAYSEHPEIEGRHSKGHRYDLNSTAFSQYPELFSENKPSDEDDYIQILGRVNNERAYLWTKRKYVKCPDNIDKYKVFVPKANGTGAIGEVLSTPVIGQPVIGQPVIGHTLTFLSVGKFETKEEAEACLKYVKTKFARTLLGTLKVTQDNPKETWANVPIQDFTPDSDIDWTRSVDDIDQQLFVKYELGLDEIAFINEHIAPMD